MSFFSWEYFLLCGLSVVWVATILYLFYKKKWNVYKQIKIFAIVLTVGEILKILFFAINNPKLIPENWVPLFYCSLFIYALYFAGYGKGFIKQMGISAIFMLVIGAYCGVFLNDIFAGNGYPLFNFYSLYTIFYHTTMIYFGYAILISGEFKLSKKSFLAGISFVSIFFVVALVVNLIFHLNLMSMMPYRIQTKLLYNIGSILGDNLTPLLMYI